MGLMMSEFYICEKCGKTLELKDGVNRLICPVCSNEYNPSELIESKKTIDKAEESHEYGLASELYERLEYRDAAMYFERVIKLNRNNYYAHYYLAICNILSGRTYMSTGELISEMVLNSFYALYRSNASGEAKESFQFSVVNQAAAFVKDILKRLDESFNAKAANYRQNGLFLAKNIRKMFSADFSDCSANIKSILVDLISSMLKLISRSVEPQIDNGRVEMATAEDFSLARSLGTSFYNYALSFDEFYSPGDVNNVMERTFRMNNLLYGKIFELKKGSPKRFAQVSGEDDEVSMFSEKMNALKISYCTCFKGIGIPVDEHKKKLLVEQTYEIMLSSLNPRIVINNSGDAEIKTLTFDSLRIISSYLTDFINEMAKYSEYKLNSSLDNFYRNLYANVFNYYSIMYSNYNRLGDIIRRQKSKELYYLRSFFYSILCVSALATYDFISYNKHNLEYRKKLLKMGVDASEAFLYLYNYNLENVEKSIHYRDFYSLANTVENELKTIK